MMGGFYFLYKYLYPLNHHHVYFEIILVFLKFSKAKKKKDQH
jgi:hypothetical protein